MTQQYGISAALISNILFAVLYLYSGWLAPLSGTDVFAWRMVTMLISLWGMVMLGKNWSQCSDFIQKMWKNWRFALLVLLPTPILGFQLWLFMWAPINGLGVDVAMGYFLFPLTMVVFARIFLGTRANRLQSIALMVAAMGVAYELWRTQSFAWATWAVCLLYPVYYLLRRHAGVPALIGLLVDLSLIAPFALLYLFTHHQALFIFSLNWHYALLIPALGLISAAAMQLNLYANRVLPVPLFGILSYLEPSLLFLCAWLVLDTPLDWQALPTYLLIWLALGMCMLDGVMKMKKYSLTYTNNQNKPA